MGDSIQEPGETPSQVDGIPLTFYYIKSSSFRVMHVDGMRGAISPDAEFLQLSMFSERHPIPKEEFLTVDALGHLGPQSQPPKSLSGVVREVDATMVMTLETAIRVRELLDKLIPKGIAARKQAEDLRSPPSTA